MYAADMPADQISQALAVCAAANYLIFDGTKQGLGLALLCALACPASEVRGALRLPVLGGGSLAGIKHEALLCCCQKATPGANPAPQTGASALGLTLTSRPFPAPPLSLPAADADAHWPGVALPRRHRLH